MTNDARLLRLVLLLTTLAVVGGTVGYVVIEGWSALDAFYMTVITLTTIGFGEVHQLSEVGRAFTMVLVLFGLGAAAMLGTQIAGMLVDGDLSAYWRNRRMERKLARLNGHVIVCGYGRIGHAICEELHKIGVTCCVIDNDPSKQEEARREGHAVMPGCATNDLALISAGVGRAKAIVAALSHDSDNVFVALSARDINPNVVIIARAEDRSLESRMRKAGVNRIVYPAQLGGGRIAHMVGEEIGLQVESSAMRRESDVLGYDLKVWRNTDGKPRTLNEIEIQSGAQRTLALVRTDGERIEDPPPGLVVEEMEAVVLLMDTGMTARSIPEPGTEAVLEPIS